MSYYPSSKTSVFATAGFTPFWGENFNSYFQGGLEARNQFTPKIEVEISYNAFSTDDFQLINNARNSTLNVCFRFNTL